MKYKIKYKKIITKIFLKNIFYIIAILFISNCKADFTSPEQANSAALLKIIHAPVYHYQLIKTFNHDPRAFTEGLQLVDGILYESSGLTGISWLSKTDFASGKILQQINLPPQYFGEGVTVLGQQVFQLTYHAEKGFIYTKKNLQLQKTFYYRGEGWGLTNDGHSLIMSNGSATLAFLDPRTLTVTRSVLAHDQTLPIINLNELEFIDGTIYANVWQTDLIAIIDPTSGAVTGWLDLTELYPQNMRHGNEDVLNGIAYDSKLRTLLVTGKLWPTIYAIQIKK